MGDGQCHLCQWKMPKKRKYLLWSSITQHDYIKSQRKDKLKNKDPRPVLYRSQLFFRLYLTRSMVNSLVDSFCLIHCMAAIKAFQLESLHIATETFSQWQFKSNLMLPKENLQKIEQDTRGQCQAQSIVEFSLSYCINASHFGVIPLCLDIGACFMSSNLRVISHISLSLDESYLYQL